MNLRGLSLLVSSVFAGVMLSGCGSAEPAKKENDPLMPVFMVNSKSEYAKVAKKFVGINPINGLGSGFALKDKDGYGVRSPDFGKMKQSGGPRVNMCTCDCVAGDDGVGCVGTAGVNFKYSNLLWVDPIDGKTWRGQQQGFQLVNDNGTDTELNYMGDDTRLFPGGPVIYNVACTSQDCNGFFSGVFRQANHAISCKTGIEDKTSYNTLTDDNDKQKTCFHRCTNSDTYKAWLQYCEADTEDTSKGFFGYWDKSETSQAGASEGLDTGDTSKCFFGFWDNSEMSRDRAAQAGKLEGWY